MTPRAIGWVLALGALGAARPLQAQEGDASSREGRSRSPSRFFDRPIDFWRADAGEKERSALPPGGLPDAKSPPGESSTAPGRVPGAEARELAPAFARVIEDPSPENIRAYLGERLRRIERILQAAERIREYQAQQLPDLKSAPPGRIDRERPPSAPPPVPPEPVPAPGITLSYFHREDCPPCGIQDRILAAWLPRHPEVRLRRFEFGTHPELWRASGIRGTPSLVVWAEGSERPLLLEGLSPAERLDRALGECRRSMESPPAAPGGSPP
ncbi:MAG TPA: thioredoxin family protein [Planctomycetota bacterium]|nr:thioredoxin family protein [Planctomycetota bacterium]